MCLYTTWMRYFIEEENKIDGDGNASSSWDKVTTFYNKQGEKLFKFGLAYDNVQLLVRDVKNTQRSISNQKKKKQTTSS